MQQVKAPVSSRHPSDETVQTCPTVVDLHGLSKRGTVVCRYALILPKGEKFIYHMTTSGKSDCKDTQRQPISLSPIANKSDLLQFDPSFKNNLVAIPCNTSE